MAASGAPGTAAAARSTRPSRWHTLADERLVLVLLLVLALLARVASAVAVPPWQGPDEPKHFEYARLLLDKRETLLAERRLLDPRDASPALQQAVIASLAQHKYWERVGWLPSGPVTPAVLPQRFDQIWPQGTHTQLHRPSLYYLLGAIVLAPFAQGDLESQLLALRLLSAVLATLTVLLTYAAARTLSRGDRFLPLLAAVFVAALPMHVFIGGAVNNDNLVGFLGAVVTLGLGRGFTRGFGLREWALVLGGLLLALATKRTAVALLPAVGLAGLFWFASLGRRLQLVLLALGGALALGVILGPPLFSLDRAREMLVAYALNGIHQWNNLLRIPWGSPEVSTLLLRHVAALFTSFWGIFGWFNVLLGTEYYVAFAAISGLCGLGFLLWLGGRVRSRLREPSAQAGRQLALGTVLLLVIAGTVVLALAERIAYLSPHELPQGRYLFVALAPIAIVHALGLRTLLPRRVWESGFLTPVVAMGLVALDAVAYLVYILPYYHGGNR